MINQLPRYVILFVLLLVAQVLVFNNIYISGYLGVYPYILFLLILPSDINRALLLVLAFILGISVDLFSDSPGIHASACIPIAYMRNLILRTSTSLESKNDSFEPNMHYFGGWRPYLSYAAVLVLVHHSILLFLEVFEFSHLLSTFIKIVGSSAATLIFIILIQYIFFKKVDK